MGNIQRRFSFLSFSFTPLERFFNGASLSFLTGFTLFFLFLVYQDASGGTITVKPGRFNHFTLHIPATTIAGDSFVVRLQAYDIYNNLITDFNEAGRDFEIRVSGSALVEPKILRASNFQGGSALLSIRDKKAERITISVLEMGGTLPMLTKEINIRPNRVDHFILQAPSQIKAGESFEIKVIARDAFENTVLDDTAIGKDLQINIGGTGGIKSMDTGALNFRAGVATTRFLSEKVGEVAVEIYDPLSGSRGKSPSIRIMPGGLSLLDVQTPKEAIAGEPFEVIITALDTYGNPVTNYDSTGDGVILSSTGKGKIRPDRLSPSEFKGGSAVAKVIYEVSENMEIIAREINKGESGRSGTIKIRPATPDRFLVITPDTASAGQGFKLRIEAYDRFNNPVRDYNLIGGYVYLGTTGSGTLTPSLVSPSEFIDGVAVVDAVYDKAESFSITARMALKREEIEIEPVPPKPVPEKVKEKLEEKPKPLPPEVRAVPKLEIKPEPEIKLPEKVRDKEVIKRPEPKKEIVKKEIEPRLFEVSDISIVESKKRAILVITSNGPLEHKTSLITKDGKRWLNLKVSPAVRKMEKTQRLKSAFVGDVILEEEGNVLSILLEILPETVTYEAKRAKDSIVITFTRQ